MSEPFFSESEQQRIVEAIRLAELNTSGEIRVHLEATCKGDPYERATLKFGEMGMHATALHNGILFYLAYRDKKFAVVGDQGIHEKVQQEFWDNLTQVMSEHFRNGKFTEGLSLAIAMAGDQLKKHFPYQSDDTNELSNELSFEGGENE
jgi:uncharacterized membrane protein